MKILSSLLVLLFILTLIFAACIKKVNSPVAVSNDMFPSAPQNAEATVRDKYIVLSWQMSNSNDIVKYYIFRKDTSDREFLLIDSSYIETYTDKLFEYGVDYFYEISGINLNGYQGPHSVSTGPVSIQPFPAPVILSDPIVDGTTIYLSWTQNNDTEFSSYRVYRSKSTGVNSNLSAIAVINDRTTNYYKDEDLQYSTSYYYRVDVHNKIGHSVESNEASITTNPDQIPDKVVLAVPTLIGATTLRLSWTQNYDYDFASYRIYRSESSPVDTNAAPVMIINTQTTTSYDDKSLVKNTEYFYRVFVYDKGGLCAGSEEVSGRTAP